MENASKALIMAAGVLIGVLILSLAVYLFFDFASTSSRLHEETRLNQINEFNAQFTSYEIKNDNTFYDIITLANLAKNNNQYYELTTSEEGNYYITVNVDKGTYINNLEKLSENKLNQLLKSEVNEQNGGTLPTYQCEVTISPITGLVKDDNFTKK